MKAFKGIIILIIALFIMSVLLEAICSRVAINPRKYRKRNVPTESISPWIDSLKGWELPIGQWVVNNRISGEDTLFISENRSRVSKTDTTSKYDKEISIYGGSYAFGLTLNNDEPFTSLIQKEFPRYRIQNKSVPGYGTVQMRMKLTEDLMLYNEQPDMVIVSWLSFHAYRNTFAMSHKLETELMMMVTPTLRTISRVPKCDIQNDSLIYKYEDKLRPIQNSWLLSNSALCLSVYHRVSRLLEIVNYNYHFKQSCYVLKEISEICNEHNIDFCIMGMDLQYRNKIQSWCESEDICYYNAEIKVENSKEYSLAYDPLHPNVKAHEVYFQTTTEILRNHFE